MKQTMILLTTIISIIFFFSFGNSQTALEGKVTDAISGEPILFGTVALYKNNVLLTGGETDIDGNFYFSGLDAGTYDIEASYVGYTAQRLTGIIVKSGQITRVDMNISKGVLTEEIEIIGYKVPLIDLDKTTSGGIVTAEQIRQLPTKHINDLAATTAGLSKLKNGDISIRSSRSDASVYIVDGNQVSGANIPSNETGFPLQIDHNEEYDGIQENSFKTPTVEPLSTFSIDVDRAAYSNVRRFINNGQMPPADAVRIEEMVNYFDYEYEQPKKKDPFSINTSLVDCPWNQEHQLLHIGLQGKKIATDKLPSSNLVFLIDVSGSMNSDNKLGLLKSSFKLLVKQLRAKDKVAMVVYAGAAGVVLESTAGSEQQAIIDALEKLRAGGSTAGGAGIELAYNIAQKNFIKGGNNRVILATDGDFNVGVSDNEKLSNIIEKKREKGVFLSVLGFGMGNYKDNKMQQLADKGNGNHAYIDNIQEARKVLVTEFGGTLFTIAKDVKIQIEFNPAQVSSYRLIGYENRLLNKEDFNDDTKDAGELGSGHVVTALYEIVPAGVTSSFAPSVDELKYQDNKKQQNNSSSKDLATIKLRYKKPDGKKSKKIEKTISKDSERMTNNIGFASAVAEFGMLLRESKYVSAASFENVITRAENHLGKDKDGFKKEFIRLVKNVRDMEVIVERE